MLHAVAYPCSVRYHYMYAMYWNGQLGRLWQRVNIFCRISDIRSCMAEIAIVSSTRVLVLFVGVILVECEELPAIRVPRTLLSGYVEQPLEQRLLHSGRCHRTLLGLRDARIRDEVLELRAREPRSLPAPLAVHVF